MTESLFFNYGPDCSTLPDIARPGCIIVTGMGNCYEPEFQEARLRGALVYRYVPPISRLNESRNPVELELFMGDIAKVPLWGNGRRNNSYTMMTDLRVGSAFTTWHVENLLPAIIASKLFDGVFYDVLGARPWGDKLEWDIWPESERVAWTAGALDFARRTHEQRMRLNRTFDILHNNVWHSLEPRGDQYCNGVCLEGKTTRQDFHVKYASRQFAPGLARRLLVIANPAPAVAATATSPALPAMSAVEVALAWTKVPGVTHVTALDRSQGQTYQQPTPAITPELGEIEQLQAQLAEARAELDAAQSDLARLSDKAEAMAVDLSRSETERAAAIDARAAAEKKLADLRASWQALSAGLAA